MTEKDFTSQFEQLSLPIHGVRLPTFVIENSYKKDLKITGEIDNFSFLKKLCYDGLNKLKLIEKSKEHQEYFSRLEYELQTINELGFVDYILLVWDVINFCKINDIPTGLGRGSAAGSLVLYLIGVVKVDPLKYGLYFERFISKIRAKKREIDGITYLDGSLMCDIDLDICYYNRPKVIEYLEKKFTGRVCKILTFNTLSAKLLIKECGKIVAGKSDSEMTSITELIPKVHGKVMDIEFAYEESEEFKTWCNSHVEVYKIALKLRNLIKNKGVHPSAISVSFYPLEEFTPTELDSEKSEVSSYDMNWISLFNVKLDVLGLRSVSVVDSCCKNVGINMSDINFEDEKIYQVFKDFKTPHGIFQLEAETNYKIACKVKPKNLDELAAVIALARPGALQFIDKFANYTNFGTYEPIHPFFDDILKKTGGVAIYQEQLMQMANKIGFSLDEAEVLRRIVGKKKIEEMKSWEQKVKDKVAENNLDPEIFPILWKIMNDSASYSFNLSHSIAYACLSAATIFLKFTYPKQFFLSLLQMSRHEPNATGEISKIHKEMAEFNIELLRPHITKSKLDFSIEGENIRFGLLSIKGISDKSIIKLKSFCNEYSTKFEVFEAASQHGLNMGVLCALIQAGAFEVFKQSRSAVVYEAQLWNLLTTKEKKLLSSLGEEFNYVISSIILELTKRKDKNGTPLIKPSRLETIRKNTEKFKSIYFLNKNSESFANWFYEKKLLGYTYNKTLRDIFISTNKDLQSIKEIKNLSENSPVYFVASVDANSQTRTSRVKKNKYLCFDCSDETGSINIKIFDPAFERMRIEEQKLPKEDNIVIIEGTKKEGNCVFGRSCTIQNSKIYTRWAELKRVQDIETEKLSAIRDLEENPELFENLSTKKTESI